MSTRQPTQKQGATHPQEGALRAPWGFLVSSSRDGAKLPKKIVFIQHNDAASWPIVVFSVASKPQLPHT